MTPVSISWVTSGWFLSSFPKLASAPAVVDQPSTERRVDFHRRLDDVPQDPIQEPGTSLSRLAEGLACDVEHGPDDRKVLEVEKAFAPRDRAVLAGQEFRLLDAKVT